jgi:hypothetical protein
MSSNIKREGYQLQPAKRVILPVKSKIKTIVTNEGFWKIDNRIMPVVDKATGLWPLFVETLV